MSKSVSLSGNQELQFVSDSWEKTVTVYLFDTISDTRVTLTEFVGGKWRSKSISHLDKFFELIKVNPKIRIAMKKAFSDETAEFLGYQKYHVGGLEFLGYFLLGALLVTLIIVGLALLIHSI